jgi:hypothetical protein
MPTHNSTRSSDQVIKASRLLFALLVVCACSASVCANKRRAIGGRQRALVVDERLAALRREPSLTAPLVQRLGRGRVVAILSARRTSDGSTFYRVAATRRTRGWLPAESVVAPAHAGADARLLRLIESAADFERIARARIFLDECPRSPLRPRVLLLYGQAAEEAAAKLSHEAARRLKEEQLPADGAPLRSYYLNYNGLDRYNRQGVTFLFDQTAREFHYDGASWRELVQRYPHSPEAAEAQRHLTAPNTATMRR